MGSLELVITIFTLVVSISGTACAVILPLLILGIVGYVLYKRSQQSSTYRQSAQNWPSTNGTIVLSTVESRHTGTSRSTYPVVVYTYQVNGINFQSQSIKTGDKYMSIRFSGDALKTATRYPVGSTVTVYYDPANPAESALER